MTTVVQINICSNLSTGKVMKSNHERYLELGYKSYLAFSRGPLPEGADCYVIGSKLDRYVHAGLSRITGRVGSYSTKSTRELIKWIEEIDPNIIHLHNVHGYYINIELLFEYLAKRFQGEVVWTLHDCWAFTGHCAYFTYVQCEKWKTGCDSSCPQLASYPKTYNRFSCALNYSRKKELFTAVENMSLITPSQWLADLVGKSYLGIYPVKVERNSIDSTVFNPVDPHLAKATLGIEEKRVLLAVASTWEPRKGLKDVFEISHLLDDDWKVVVVGLSKGQMKSVPTNVMGLERTNTVRELVELYSCADVFFNPTYEENFPTVNLEAEACGTPVFCFNVGGCAETLTRSDSRVFPVRDLSTVATAVELVKPKEWLHE